MTTAPARPLVGLTVLAFAVLGAITTEVVPIGLMPAIVTAFDVDEAGAGMLVSLYAALVAITAVPLTLATRKFQRKPLLLATLLVFTLSNTLAAVAPNFAVLVSARALGGVAHALFFAISIGYAVRIAPRGQTGRAIAFVATGTSAGLIIGVPAGTALASVVDWRTSFAVLAIITLIAGLAAAKFLPPVTHDPGAARTIVPGGGRLLLVAGLAGLAFLGYYALYTYVSPLLLSSGLPLPWLGLALAALGITGLLGIRVAAGRLDQRPYTWMVIVPAAIAVTQIAVVVAYPQLWPVLIVAAVWTASFGPVNATYQNVLVRVGRDSPEMAGAWINVTCNVGIGAGTALGGALVVGYGYPVAGLAGAAILLVSLAVTLTFRRGLRAAEGEQRASSDSV